DLSMTEWRVMAVLARFEGMSAREVAERTAMDKVAVSRALSRLVEAGRVDRATHDNDKRRSVLSLTDAGWAVHDEVAPMARVREREVLARLDVEERVWLERILDKLQVGNGERGTRAENPASTRDALAVPRSPFPVPRSPFPVPRSPFPVPRSPFPLS